MLELAEEEPKLCAITAAMPGGTGLLEFKKQHPNRLFDVGIAEEHAVSMAGGLAKQGMIPVVALYSTFLQRSYDMILQDIGMLGLHTVLAVDRAGLVGEDGETHHGIYDIGFLRQVPGLRILAPATYCELQSMLRWAVLSQSGPVAIRYPRGSQRFSVSTDWNDQMIQVYGQGDDVTIITYGNLTENALQAAQLLQSQGVACKVVRLLQINPIPFDEICNGIGSSKHILIVEETAGNSGIREAVACTLAERFPETQILGYDLGAQYVTHGNVDGLYAHYGLDAKGICHHIQEVLKVEN